MRILMTTDTVGGVWTYALELVAALPNATLWAGRASFVPPDDHDALRQAVTELIDNPTRRHELADVARCHALSFSPERMAKDYLKAYTQLLSKRPAPTAERAR